uniref:Uncharacterized protein n=1 Tax=Chaetoceros debilis TaxID=122233 RepID=A0A7S3Q562_9STRA
MELPHEELMKDIQISTATSSNSWLSSAMSQPCSSAYYYTDESDNESVDLYYDDAELSLAQPIGPFVQEGPDSGLTLYVDDKEPSTTNIRPAYYRDWDEITYDHEFISPTAADFPLHTIIENSSSGELDPPSNFTVDPFLQGGDGSKKTSSKDDHERPSPISNTENNISKALSIITRDRELLSEEDLAQAFITIIESNVLHPALQEAIETITQNKSVELPSQNNYSSSSSREDVFDRLSRDATLKHVQSNVLHPPRQEAIDTTSQKKSDELYSQTKNSSSLPERDVFDRLSRDAILKHANLQKGDLKEKVDGERVMKTKNRTKRSTNSSIVSSSDVTSITSASTMSNPDSSFEQHHDLGAVKNDVFSRLYNARKVSFRSLSDNNDTYLTATFSNPSQKQRKKIRERTPTKFPITEVYARLYDDSSRVHTLQKNGRMRREEIETLIAKRHEIPNFSDHEKIPLSRATDFYYKCIKKVLEADRKRRVAARERDLEYEPRYNFVAI